MAYRAPSTQVDVAAGVGLPPHVVGLRKIKCGVYTIVHAALALVMWWLAWNTWRGGERWAALVPAALATYLSLCALARGWLGWLAARDRPGMVLDAVALRHCVLPPLPWNQVTGIAVRIYAKDDVRRSSRKLEVSVTPGWPEHFGWMRRLRAGLLGVRGRGPRVIVIPLGLLEGTEKELAHAAHLWWRPHYRASMAEQTQARPPAPVAAAVGQVDGDGFRRVAGLSGDAGSRAIGRLRLRLWGSWVAALAIAALACGLLAIYEWHGADYEVAGIWGTLGALFAVPSLPCAAFGLLADRLGGVFVVDGQGLRHCMLRGTLRWDQMHAIEIDWADPRNPASARISFRLHPHAFGAAEALWPNFLIGFAYVQHHRAVVGLRFVQGQPEQLLEQVLRVGRWHGWSPVAPAGTP